MLSEVSAPRHRAVVLLPTYNERENISAVTRAILGAAPVDVMVIDDSSSDGTGEIADDIAKAEPHLFVMHRPKKNGQGRAYVDGMKRALELGYELVFTMDADFSHPPQKISEMLSAAERYDLVIASRGVTGGRSENRTLLRDLLSRGGGVYARTILGTPVRDMTSGFKCFHRRVLEAIDLGAIQSNGYAFHIEIIYRSIARGFRASEVPFVFVDRTAGTSKMSAKIMWEALLLCPKLRLNKR
jgi:dolichol-phosphate mannosyltransferase